MALANQDGFSESYPNGESFVDTDVFQTCVGGSEGPGNVGEGPCSPTSTGLGCTNPTTEGLNGPQACPTNDPLSAALCEFSDGNCQPKGSRPVMINGSPGEETWPIAGCQDNQFQNGDLDFDGTDYQSISWPNGTPNHPTPASYIGPFTGGRAYPTIQFETDVAGSEFLCDPATGTDCVAPPLGANFYPYWTLGNSKRAQVFPGPKGQCVWNIGKTIPGLTSQDFGRTAEYGTSNVARYGGTVISSPMPNPEFSGRCGGKNRAHRGNPGAAAARVTDSLGVLWPAWTSPRRPGPPPDPWRAWTYTPARSATRSRCQRESPNAWALACARLRKKWRSCS